MLEGICKCINVPKNTNFLCGHKYNFQLMPGYNSKEGHVKKKYFRVFPLKDIFTQYEVFTPDIFDKHFIIIQKMYNEKQYERD